jgi:penicillin-binding protein 1A
MNRFQTLLQTAAHHVRHPTRRGIAIAIAALPALALLYVLLLVPFTPSISDLQKVKTAKPSVLMSADGKELAVFKRANRDWVKLAAISPHVVDALIATEDRRFYDHNGIDYRRTAGAVFKTLTGDLQGGSTITQQLARNLYPDDIGRAATINRKLKEAITAFKIEAVYTKDEILETYLNTVPFLYNAYGIEMAARTYFDKSADKLDVLEGATLVGMLKGTSYYNPVTRPERAQQRRNLVLSQMARSGKLDEPALAKLKAAPMRIDFERQTDAPGSMPHLALQARKWLIEWADRNDYNIYADGLVVRTTIDSRVQEAAVKSLTEHTARLQQYANASWGQASIWKGKSGSRRELVLGFMRETKEYKAAVAAGQADADALKALLADAKFMQALKDDKTRLQAGFMAVDPTTGHVLAWVGSRDFATDQFDHVQQARRQPGSTFKPFVYAAAIDNGAKSSDTFIDGDIEIPLGDGNVWRPTDGGGASYAPMTLRQGLMYSKNTITAQVMQLVGPQRVAQLARALGVRHSKLDEVPSLALGTSPVTLREMVTAYGSLANEGRYIESIYITSVEDRDGTVLERFVAAPAETVLQVSTAHTTLDMLRGAVDQGTGAGIRSRYGIKADVAGKTGTTQNNTDAWFVLMHPQMVAGAWVGFNDNRITMGSGWGQGSQAALPIVGETFRLALKAKAIDEKREFAAPRETYVAPAPPPETEPPSTDPANGPPGAPAEYQVNAPAEGTWRPAPEVRYVTVPQAATPEPGVVVPAEAPGAPRVLAPPDGRWGQGIPATPAVVGR